MTATDASDPVKQAKAQLWRELDDIAEMAKAGTCHKIVEAIEALIDAKTDAKIEEINRHFAMLRETFRQQD